MPINNITQTISTLPPAGSRGVDVQTQFVIKQEDFQDHLQGTTVTELNTLKDQLNSRIGEINSTTTTMNGYANTASTKASEASTSATSASTSASTATTKASQASASASTATTQAGIATTKANEASASASTSTTQAGIATTQAGIATTQAGIATTKANEASASASTSTTQAGIATTQAGIATTQAGIATTKANEASASATSASASATSATTSRNQAETFAQQAQASATSVDINNIVHRTNNENIAGVKTFSSSPIVPTPTAGDNSTKVATTAFVKAKSEADSIGVGQTWQNVTASRSAGVTYTNTTGKPIEIAIQTSISNSTTGISIFVDGLDVVLSQSSISSGTQYTFGNVIVPDRSTYSLTILAGGVLRRWYELR